MAGSGLPQLSITVFIAESLIFEAPPPKKVNVSNSKENREQNGTTEEPRGTRRVQDGTGRVQDGTGRVQDGTGKEDGTGRVQDGTGKQDGTGRVQDGTGRVQDGTGRVQDRTGRVQDGTGKEDVTEEELRDKATGVRRLQDLVLSSYNFTASHHILVIATHTPFQVSVWASDGVGLGENDTFIAQEIARTSFTSHHHLFTAIINALHSLCQKLRMQEAGYTTHWFVLTAIWVFFSVIFVLGLTCTAVFLIRAKRRQNRSASIEGLTRDSGDCRTRSSRPHQRRDLTPSDLTSVMYISSGHVLLSTTDITALAPSNCSSTDNLLNT